MAPPTKRIFLSLSFWSVHLETQIGARGRILYLCYTQTLLFLFFKKKKNLATNRSHACLVFLLPATPTRQTKSSESTKATFQFTGPENDRNSRISNPVLSGGSTASIHVAFVSLCFEPLVSQVDHIESFNFSLVCLLASQFLTIFAFFAFFF